MNKLFAILCWSALVVSAAVPMPLRTDYFTQGCGGDGQGDYYQPVVADDGAVAVIAPAPDEPYIPSTPQRGGYLVSADDLSVTQLFKPGSGLIEFPGVASFFFYRAACSIVADGGRENFWDVSFDVVGTDLVSPRIHHYSAASGEESIQDVDIGYTSDLILRLLPSADGSTAFLHAVDGSDTPWTATGLYSLNQEKITLGKSISLPHDLGFAPAFTADGTVVFYIGLDEEFSTENAMLALYRYNLETETAVMLEDIGLRNSLKVYDGKYHKDIPILATNADGSVVVYRWANGSVATEAGVQLRVAVKNAVTGDYEFGFASRLSGADQTLLVDETNGKGTNALDCQEPAVSADGRYIAFTARATNASVGATVRQAWRYDRQEQCLECLSDGLLSDCHAVALSPNGRHAAFVATDSGTALPQVFRVDCGPAITLSERQMVLHPKETMELGVEVVATAEATVTVAGDFPGVLMTVEGDEVLAGTSYPANTLPWSLFAETDAGYGNLTITVTERENTVSAELSIIISKFANLTRGVLPRSALYSYSYSDIHFTSNGREAVLLTDAPLVPQDTDRVPVQDVYRLDVATGMLQLLTGDITFSNNVYSPQISGDGNVVYWVSQAGELWTDSGVMLASGVSQLAPAVSYDGTVLVVRKGNALWRSKDSGAAWTQVRVDDVPETAVYNTPMLSYDGGVLAFTVKRGDQLSLYIQDGVGVFRQLASEISALEGLMQDGERVLVRQVDGSFAWISVGNAKATKVTLLPPEAREVSLAGNGRFVAYVAPSSEDATLSGVYLLDLGKGTATEVTAGADENSFSPVLAASGKLLLFSSDATNLIDGLVDANEERDLFLYTNPNWTNSLPGFTGTKIDKGIYEDPEEAYALNLYLRDNNDDALVPSLDIVATLGTARLVPPCEGQLDYRLSYLPPKDFCGTDTVRVRAWDGTGWSAWNTLQLVVQNVNDEPVWDEDTPTTLELMAGSGIQVMFHATDADEANPEPDVLKYSLAKGAPSWASINVSTGLLTLRPGFEDDGTFTLTAIVFDGVVTAEHQITVTVTPLTECEIPLTMLHTTGKLPDGMDPKSALGKWMAAFSGCWVSFGNGWQTLSLPGDARIKNLCAVLGCEQIWLYSTGMYIAVSEGTLPAGTGFWAKVVWPDDVTGISLFLTPTLQRIGELPRFCGPLVDEAPPNGLHGVDVERHAWVDCPDWQPGRGYFRY